MEDLASPVLDEMHPTSTPNPPPPTSPSKEPAASPATSPTTALTTAPTTTPPSALHGLSVPLCPDAAQFLQKAPLASPPATIDLRASQTLIIPLLDSPLPKIHEESEDELSFLKVLQLSLPLSENNNDELNSQLESLGQWSSSQPAVRNTPVSPDTGHTDAAPAGRNTPGSPDTGHTGAAPAGRNTPGSPDTGQTTNFNR